jgi:NAD-reducing hydrogenase small subunit
MDHIKVATVWLSGCSGCHMSFLDLDEFLIDVADKIELVYSPIMDLKEYPKNVDLVLVEGAVGYDEQIHFAKLIRQRSKIVISFGDCAMTGNVPAMRNPFGKPEVVQKRGFIELTDENPQIPKEDGVLPVLLDRVRPLHEVINVDYYLPGCPPPASRIKLVVGKLLAGEKPVLEGEDLKNG